MLLLWLTAAAIAKEFALLLHGMRRTELPMSWIADALSEAGFEVWNLGYPSTEADVKALSEQTTGPGMAKSQFKAQI